MPERSGRRPAADTALGHQAEAEWHRLRQQLALAEGFWLGFLFSTSPAVSRTFRLRTEGILRSRALALRAILPGTPAELQGSLPRLFDPSPNTGCLWLEATRIDTPRPDENEPPPWTRAWDQLLLRLNERRDRLRRTLDCGLLLVAHPRVKPRVRDAAPDLWSVRSIVLEPVPGPVDAPVRRLDQTLESDPRGEHAARRLSRLPLDRDAPSPRRQTGNEVREPEAEYGDTPREADPSAARLLRRAAGELQAGHSRDAIDHAVRAIEILDSVQPPEGPDRAAAYALLAEAEMADGDPASADGHLRRALELLDDPLDRRALGWLDTLLAIADDLGDLATAEDLAREQVRRSRARLDSDDPSPATLRDLSIALERLGDTLNDRGDTEKALRAFEDSLQIRRRLLETSGESPQARRDLSVSLDKLGDTLKNRGDTEEALQAFEESLRIARRLLEAYGQSPQALRDLAIVLFHLGRLHRSQETPGGAADLLTEAAELERRRAQLYGAPAGEPQLLLIILRELASLLRETEGEHAARLVLEEIERLEQGQETAGEAEPG